MELITFDPSGIRYTTGSPTIEISQKVPGPAAEHVDGVVNPASVKIETPGPKVGELEYIEPGGEGELQGLRTTVNM